MTGGYLRMEETSLGWKRVHSSVRRTETLMAVTLKFAPGSTIRWGAKRFVVVDYVDMDSIVARELGKRRLERIPVQETAPDRSLEATGLREHPIWCRYRKRLGKHP